MRVRRARAVVEAGARPAAAARFLRGALLGLLSWSGCNGTAPPPPSTSILDLNGADRSSDGVVDVQSLAIAGGHVLRPIDGVTGRPVRCLEVLDVDLLRVESDRGEEVVRVFGLGGCDERLPAELNEFLREVARREAEVWLTWAQGTLEEVSVPLYAERGAAAGPSHRDADGHRLISLRRHAGTTTEDYQEIALASGWAYEESPYDDILALDLRLTFHARGDRGGLHRLDCVRRMDEDFEREAREVRDIDPEALQALGEEVFAEVAEFLDWDPAEELTFHSVTPEQATAPFRDVLLRHRDVLRAWLDRRLERARAAAAERGEESEVEGRIEFSDLQQEVAELIRSVDGYSPVGPDVWILQKGNASHALLRQILVHEVMHQYQEEVVALDGVFPFIITPYEVGEAQAEWLARQFREAQAPEGAPRGTLNYDFAVALFDSVLRDTGLTHVELLHRFLHEEWDRDLWNDLRNGMLGLQEWRFLQLGATDWEGLSFEAVVQEDGLPRVRVRNTADTPYRGQFHGVWVWAFDVDGQKGNGQINMAPFNLELPAGGAVVVQLGDGVEWIEHPPVRVAGLFSQTP